MDIAAILASARWTLADELERLSAEQWRTESLCEGWTAHDVLAHINMAWAISPMKIGIGVAKAKGNFDVAVDGMSRGLAASRTPKQLIQGLRDNAANTRSAPMLTARAPLTDLVCHAGDILQPLHRDVAFAPEVLAAALGFLVGDDTGPIEARGRAVGFLPPARVEGLVLAPDGMDQRFGSGPAEVAGPPLAIVGALLNRKVWLAQLSGTGARLLASRLAA